MPCRCVSHLAANGRWYTYTEFVIWYGDRAENKWYYAGCQSGAAEHDGTQTPDALATCQVVEAPARRRLDAHGDAAALAHASRVAVPRSLESVSSAVLITNLTTPTLVPASKPPPPMPRADGVCQMDRVTPGKAAPPIFEEPLPPPPKGPPPRPPEETSAKGHGPLHKAARPPVYAGVVKPEDTAIVEQLAPHAYSRRARALEMTYASGREPKGRCHSCHSGLYFSGSQCTSLICPVWQRTKSRCIVCGERWRHNSCMNEQCPRNRFKRVGPQKMKRCCLTFASPRCAVCFQSTVSLTQFR